MRKVFLVILALASLGIGCSSNTTTTTTTGQIIRDISVSESNTLIQQHQGDPDFVILDVRTIAEFSEGHIEGAVQLDFYAADFEAELGKLDKSKTYLVYCRTSNRSGQAVNKMENLGFEEVYDMDGGIVAWGAAGYPTVK